MYKCNECKEYFEEPKQISADVLYGDYDATRPCNTKIDVCPYCESGGFEQVYECEGCGRYFTEFELEYYNGKLLCETCIDEEENDK